MSDQNRKIMILMVAAGDWTIGRLFREHTLLYPGDPHTEAPQFLAWSDDMGTLTVTKAMLRESRLSTVFCLRMTQLSINGIMAKLVVYTVPCLFLGKVQITKIFFYHSTNVVWYRFASELFEFNFEVPSVHYD